ncbi:MAG TPA: prephenate dehydrogenase/arogenate dehydrogenase family protein [Pantanalinema sp.]
MARICLVGLGLIGGSLHMALSGHHDLIGVDPDPAVLALAKERGIEATKDLAAGVEGADLVIVAVPLGKIPQVFKQLAPLVKPGTLVTDVGSVKGTVVRAGAPLFLEGAFVGGHPMAGTEQRGLSNAAEDLFEGCTYVLTPTNDAERKAGERVKELLAPLKARFVEMEPAAHDLAVAYTSHMPFLMATSVARIAQGATKDVPDLPLVAAAGFRDTTRLAMSNPTLGADICMANREALLHAIAAMRYQLSQFEIMLQNEITVGLEGLFSGVGKWREELKL